MSLRILSLLIFNLLLQYESIAHPTVEELFITSDTLVLDKQNSKAEFSGLVLLYADDMVLKTSGLVVKIKELATKHVVDHITIPAKLTATKHGIDEVVMADSAEYDPSTGVLEFKGNIYMQKNQHIVKCDNLIYHTQINAVAIIKND
jgi:lipopolysaccharide export system protein LptA